MQDNYYEFKDSKDADKWINIHYKEFIIKIRKDSNKSGTLGDALFCYTGNMSKDYNNILRLNGGNIVNIEDIINKYYNLDGNNYIEYSFNRFYANEAKNDIKLIYNAFSLNIIKDNILLFHYFNINNFDNNILKKNNFKINNFISTTMVRNLSGITKLINKKNYNSLLVIKVKKGTQCIPIGNNSNSILNEYEIILKPRTCFKIKKIKRNWFNRIKYIIECELIN